MPSCVMRFCANYSSKACKSLGITYHSFPLDELRRIKWVNIVRKQRKEDDWQPNKSSKICSVHFKSEHKKTSSKGLTILKKSAYPVLENPYLPAQQRSDSPNSLSEEEISDTDSIFDTPLKAALKNCARKLKLQNKELLNKNRNLMKKNKRLQIKVASMSKILQILKRHISDEQFSELLNDNTL